MTVREVPPCRSSLDVYNSENGSDFIAELEMLGGNCLFESFKKNFASAGPA